MPAQMTCPHCDKVLKSSAPLPAGKKVKCPGCGEGFVTRDEPEATAIQAKAGVNGSRRAVTADDRPGARKTVDDVDRPRRPRVDDEEDDAPRGRGRKAKKA